MQSITNIPIIYNVMVLVDEYDKKFVSEEITSYLNGFDCQYIINGEEEIEDQYLYIEIEDNTIDESIDLKDLRKILERRIDLDKLLNFIDDIEKVIYVEIERTNNNLPNEITNGKYVKKLNKTIKKTSKDIKRAKTTEKPSGDVILYHFAHNTDRESIQNLGLLPTKPGQDSGAKRMNNPVGVYFFTKEALSCHIASHGRHYDIWTVKAKNMDLVQDKSLDYAWYLNNKLKVDNKEIKLLSQEERYDLENNLN